MKILSRIKSELAIGKVTIMGVTTIRIYPFTRTLIHGGVWWRGDVLLRPIVKRKLAQHRSADITDCIIINK